MKEEKPKIIKRIIGMDLHPELFTVAALIGDNPMNARVLWVKDRLRVSDIEAWAKSELSVGDIVLIEASGNSFEVASRLHAIGYNCSVLDSTSIGKTGKALCADDRESAVRIARVYLTGLAKEVWIPSEESKMMREVYCGYTKLVKECTRSTNRIKMFLHALCVEIPKGTELSKQKGLARILSLYEFTAERKAILESYFEQLWLSQKSKKTMEEIMSKKVLETPRLRELLKLLGISYKIAYAIGAYVGDVKRFSTSKKLVAYVGLSPRKNQSGNNAKGYERGVGKNCQNILRTIVVEGAQSVFNSKKSRWHKWGWKLFARKGSKNLAIVAVARKMIVSAWYALNGYATFEVENKSTFMRKLQNLTEPIKKEYIQSLGFATKTEYKIYLKNLIFST